MDKYLHQFNWLSRFATPIIVADESVHSQIFIDRLSSSVRPFISTMDPTSFAQAVERSLTLEIESTTRALFGSSSSQAKDVEILLPVACTPNVVQAHRLARGSLRWWWWISFFCHRSYGFGSCT